MSRTSVSARFTLIRGEPISAALTDLGPAKVAVMRQGVRSERTPAGDLSTTTGIETSALRTAPSHLVYDSEAMLLGNAMPARLVRANSRKRRCLRDRARGCV